MSASAVQNPHLHQNQHEIQKALSNYDTSFLSDDEEDLCPLCIEPLDIMDKHFKPCPCGYQICQFCYNNIRQNPELNGRCPACRRPYDDESVEYITLTPEELKMERAKQARKERERKQRERERRENDTHNRKQMAGMRVIQKNLVYVIGLNPPYPYEELPSILRSDKYFGQYGKINKIVINKKTGHEHHSVSNHSNSGYGIYVTFARKDDAAKCIQAIDGIYIDGHQVKAAYGTTKYCSSYLRGQPCPNPSCMFLHEPGEEADAFNNARKDHSFHTHAPPPPGLMKSSNSGGSTPKLAAASLRAEDSNSSGHVASVSKVSGAPVLTPAPVPSGSNPWGISQAPTPVSTVFNRTASSTTFPTLSSSLTDSVTSPGPTTPVNGGSASAITSSGTNSKKKGEKNYEDPYDPMVTCIKFLDHTFNFLSDIPERNYTFNSASLDDETYNSYPSLFSFDTIQCSEESRNMLGSKLCDMLTIKPVDHVSSLMPFIQNKTTPTMAPPGIAVPQPQMLQQQQQQMSLQMQMQAQQGLAQQMNQPQSNSSDLLNQLIHGKKQTAAVV